MTLRDIERYYAMQTSSHGSFAGEIDWLRSEFSSDVTERKFLVLHLAETQSQLCVTLLFCSFFYLAFTLTDIAALGYGHEALVLFLCRLGVATTAGACILSIRRQPQSVAMTRIAATLVTAVGMSSFMLVVSYRPNELPWHAMSMAIMLVVVYLFIPNRLIYSLAVAVSATGVFIILALVEGSLRRADLTTMSMLLLLANTFGFVAARRFHRLWREEFRAQSILKNLSVRDHLTGCFNRRYLHEKLLDNEISRAHRYGLCLTAIMCDIDHFKAINDRFGHNGGDAVLQTLSRLLKNMTREHIDSIVRYGGEEFLVILPETSLEGGVLLAERLRFAFADAATIDPRNQRISATASFGVATIDFAYPRETITLFELITTADELLYDAKNGGRNQVRSLQLS